MVNRWPGKGARVLQAGSQPVPGTFATGGFGRQHAAISGRVTWDGSSGFLAESGRYQLYASLADPWSHRALIARRLLGLERVIGLTLTDPIPGERGWRFPDAAGGRDPVTGASWLAELYLATDRDYAGRCTVPLLWDTHTQRIVTNYYTAKRMLQALHMSVQRHEQAFGVLETDVQKRVIGNRAGRPQAT